MARTSGAAAESAAGNDGSARKKPARRLALKLILVTVATLLLLEAAVRFRQWSRFGTTEDYYQFAHHEASGLEIPEPGLVVGPISINSLGFRGPEIEQPKPQGRIRIGFLGGSTTFCAEASSDAHAWPQLVLDGLRDRHPEHEFDFVNGACAGYSTIQSHLNLTHRVAPLDPDVLFVYHGTNDLTHDSRVAAAAEGRYELGTREQSVIADYWLTWSLVEKNLKFRARRNRAQDESDPFRPDFDELSAPFRGRLSDLLDDCLETAEVVIVPTFRQRARADQSPEELLQACASSLYYMPFMNPRALLDGFAKYNDILREIVPAKGAELVEGELDIPGDGAHFADSVHFTDAGCRLMADQMLAALDSSAAFAELLANTKSAE